MIVAGHVGEDVVLLAAAGGAGAASALLALVRVRVGGLMRRLRRR